MIARVKAHVAMWRARLTRALPAAAARRVLFRAARPRSKTQTRMRCLPSRRSTVPAMYLDERPASSYCSAWVPASMKLSGSTMGRTRSLPSSRRPSSARRWSTWSPKPPTEPSSMVTSTSWDSASDRRRSTSRGFMKRASATVTDTSGPCSLSTSRAASTAGASRVPMERSATRWEADGLPCLITRPLPMGTGSPRSGMVSRLYPKRSFIASKPRAVPRGKRTAEGRSSME
mmetsp:Transcript_19842/g.66743  ORF Transcript_19842/g.66743 Transcript_19842/m.66743 type:complete len:231 (-) Transcript_19842:1648-2340(-)